MAQGAQAPRTPLRALTAAVAGAAVVLLLSQTVQQPEPTRDTSATPRGVDRAPQLLEEHDCWTGEAPADMVGEIPGHVVVQLPDGRTVLGGDRLVGKALEQVFDGTDHGLSVKGFCR